MTDDDRVLLAVDVRLAEGLRFKAYQDSEGVWTIGFGTNLQELEIDLETAQRWLDQKLAESEREAARFPWYPALSGARQRAMAELLYNLGLTRLLKFGKFLNAMAARDYVTARAELLDSRWARQVGETRATRIADLIRHG
jgi:lysozyme